MPESNQRSELRRYLATRGVEAEHMALVADPWDHEDWTDEEDVADLRLPRVFAGADGVRPTVDNSSLHKWVQSALRTIDPQLAPERTLGPETRLALQRFQENLPRLVPGAQVLPADGAISEDTLAALEHWTGTTRPAAVNPEVRSLGQQIFVHEGLLLAELSPVGPPVQGLHRMLPLGGALTKLRRGPFELKIPLETLSRLPRLPGLLERDTPPSTPGGSTTPAPPPASPAPPDPTSTEPGPTTLVLADVSTFPRWVQSVLRATVAPALVVDGDIGPLTRQAITAFQAQTPGPAPSSGQLDDPTIAALEAVSGTTHPNRPGEGNVTITNTVSTPAVATTMVDAAGATWQVVGQDGDEVRFRYHTKERSLPELGTVVDPYNVWNYDGAKTRLVTDTDLAAIGYSPSGIKILKANALKESGGKFGAMNTWDNQFVSWGLAQFAGHAGTLANVLAHLKEEAASEAAFHRFFVANGIDVAYATYPYWNRSVRALVTRTGWHVVVTDGEEFRGDVAWLYIRTRPRLIGAFMLAGNDRSIQLGQLDYWRRRFLENACDRDVMANDRAFRDYVKSELAIGLGVRLFNWMPAYLAKWFREISGEIAAELTGLAIADPGAWSAEAEARFITKMKDRRRAAKTGSWDDYGPELDEGRGSYT